MSIRYQLSISAEKVPQGLMQSTHPYAVLQWNNTDDQQQQFQRTETIRNARTPEWIKTFFVDADASVFLPITVQLFNDQGGPVNNHVLLGQCSFEATEIVQSVGRIKSETLNNGIIIRASMEQSQQGDDFGIATLRLRGLDLKNVEPGLLGLGRSDPFFEVARKNADHAAGLVRWNTIYRSEHISNHLNPYWEPFSMNLEVLCYNDLNWPIRVRVLDFQKSGRHRIIGSFETTLQKMLDSVCVRGNADRDVAFFLFNEDGETVNNNDQSRGLVVVVSAELTME